MQIDPDAETHLTGGGDQVGGSGFDDTRLPLTDSGGTAAPERRPNRFSERNTDREPVARGYHERRNTRQQPVVDHVVRQSRGCSSVG